MPPSDARPFSCAAFSFCCSFLRNLTDLNVGRVMIKRKALEACQNSVWNFQCAVLKHLNSTCMCWLSRYEQPLQLNVILWHTTPRQHWLALVPQQCGLDPRGRGLSSEYGPTSGTCPFRYRPNLGSVPRGHNPLKHSQKHQIFCNHVKSLLFQVIAASRLIFWDEAQIITRQAHFSGLFSASSPLVWRSNTAVLPVLRTSYTIFFSARYQPTLLSPKKLPQT
jgi:hypothetical protein